MLVTLVADQCRCPFCKCRMQALIAELAFRTRSQRRMANKTPKEPEPSYATMHEIITGVNGELAAFRRN